MTLEQVLADIRGEAAVLRANGHGAQASSMEAVADRVRDCMQSYLDWLTEDEAQLRSGRSATWLRAQFGRWLDIGMARWQGEGRRAKRQYRRCIVPQRPNAQSAYEAGRRAA